MLAPQELQSQIHQLHVLETQEPCLMPRCLTKSTRNRFGFFQRSAAVHLHNSILTESIAMSAVIYFSFTFRIQTRVRAISVQFFFILWKAQADTCNIWWNDSNLSWLYKLNAKCCGHDLQLLCEHICVHFIRSRFSARQRFALNASLNVWIVVFVDWSD